MPRAHGRVGGIRIHHLRSATFVLEMAGERVLIPADGETLSELAYAPPVAG